MKVHASRFLLLTGLGLSLIVFGLALFLHNSLHNKDLERAGELEAEARRRLETAPVQAGRLLTPTTPDAFEAALLELPDIAPVDAVPFYDVTERTLFARSRWPAGIIADDDAVALTAPRDVRARYEAGAVALRWTTPEANRRLAADLPSGHRLVYRVYRSQGLGPLELVQSLPQGLDRWLDDQLPLARDRLAYEVWAVLEHADEGGEGELVSAERSPLQLLEIPDHFQMSLLDGDPTQATVRVEMGPAGQAVVAHEVVLHPGETLTLGGTSTGLVLTGLEEVITTREVSTEHLVIATDGRLLLDADGAPRTSPVEALLPVTRLIATLTDSSGAERTLELDLP